MRGAGEVCGINIPYPLHFERSDKFIFPFLRVCVAREFEVLRGERDKVSGCVGFMWSSELIREILPFASGLLSDYFGLCMIVWCRIKRLSTAGVADIRARVMKASVNTSRGRRGFSP